MKYLNLSIYCLSAGLIAIGIYFFLSFMEYYPWPSYTDPYGRYTLLYPSDTYPDPPKSRDTPLYISIGPNDVPGLADMKINSTSSDKYVNFTLYDLKDLSIFEINYLLPTFSMVDQPSYIKYKIDNRPAVSYSFEYGYGGKTKELYVGTKINDTIFQIGFRTAKDYQFDFYLPTVEKIIRSLKIT
jgi:hypothetical protein